MRILAPLILSLLTLINQANADALYPPGLLPLINRANALLSAGQFSDAANVYSEAIEQSPSDYLLYYKRATAYLSLSRHGSALDDFDKVLKLTGDTFDNAHLMKARIHLKEGDLPLARKSIDTFIKAKPRDPTALEMRDKIEEASKLHTKAQKERRAQLSNACVESASTFLRDYSPYSVSIRTLRAECSMLSGDVAGAVGDYVRLGSLLPAEEAMQLQLRIFRLSYFFLSAPEESGSNAALNPLKQCLHYDPDNKGCLSLHRQAKSFERSFSKLQDLLSKEDWRGVVGLLTESGKGKEKNLLNKFDEAMVGNTKREQLVPKLEENLPLPNPVKSSPRRQTLIRALCRAYTKLASASTGSAYLKKSEVYCTELLGMEGCEEDIDGLVGKAAALLASDEDSDQDEGVRLLETAFEASGRSDRDIHTKLNEAKKQVKMRRRKDYYKVLNVSRDADQKTIKKAFRKAAKSAHPDKGGSEQKMAAVNEAYEVLSKPELRARFDAGDDPNDPTSGPGGPGGFQYAYNGGGGGFGGGDPFQQFFGGGGGFPGGGANFKFHYGGHP